MARSNYESVDAYIAAQPTAAQTVLQRVRTTILKALPGATEAISYQIPVYKLDGRMVLYFAGFKQHYSIYPATEAVISALQPELKDLLHNKATIRFAFTDAVPTRLIIRIAKLRAAEALQLAAQKPTRNSASKRTKSQPHKSTKKAAKKR